MDVHFLKKMSYQILSFFFERSIGSDFELGSKSTGLKHPMRCNMKHIRLMDKIRVFNQSKRLFFKIFTTNHRKMNYNVKWGLVGDVLSINRTRQVRGTGFLFVIFSFRLQILKPSISRLRKNREKTCASKLKRSENH